MTYEPGDVVVVPFPYTDLKSKKVRPALVMSLPVHGGMDIILCAMTSNLAAADHSVLVEPADMAAGRLVKTSRVKATQIMTVEARIIRKRVGTIKDVILENVRKELRALLRA